MPGPLTGAGYSEAPLAQKLGLRDGQRVLFLGLPPELHWLTDARPFAEVRCVGWEDFGQCGGGWDLVHGFTGSRAQLGGAAGTLLPSIGRNGAVWLSWPKRSSRVPTDITEDVIREVLLPTGLVDVKVCAVDDIWSGLKLVIRKALRERQSEVISLG